MKSSTVGETEVEQLQRFNNQKSAALERAHDTTFALNKALNAAQAEILILQKRIWELEQKEHCCGSCGCVTRPSNYADGC